MARNKRKNVVEIDCVDPIVKEKRTLRISYYVNEEFYHISILSSVGERICGVTISKPQILSVLMKLEGRQ